MKNFADFCAGLNGSSLMFIGLVKPDSQYGFLLQQHILTLNEAVFEIDQNTKTTPVLAVKGALDKALVQAECFA